jgi:hypothetical protein
MDSIAGFENTPSFHGVKVAFGGISDGSNGGSGDLSVCTLFMSTIASVSCFMTWCVAIGCKCTPNPNGDTSEKDGWGD